MDLYQEALKKFANIYSRVRRSKVVEPTAATLATADAQGRPSARMILLKSFDESGFVFYTNLHSRKGSQLNQNPRAALCFYWDPLDEQIRVEGNVELVSDEEADTYWATRLRESQIGAWASHQSRELDRRSTFLRRVQKINKQYQGKFI